MTKIAWIFPGQGSQFPGMGLNLIHHDQAQKRFAQAEAILGWSVLELSQGPEEQLARTLYTQPCLYVIEAILVDLLLHQGAQPHLVAGHSLGEYVAMYTAKVFDFETGLKLVKLRAELMDQTAGGKMAAVMKFDREQLENLINQGQDVVIANDNSPEQAVISGTPEGVDQVLALVKAKRTVPLKVSGAFHSPLMAEAAAKFQQALDGVDFPDAQIPVLSNVNPLPTVKGDELKARLGQQMTSPVRWREISLELAAMGVTEVIEVGPGKVLTGLLKRTCPDLILSNIDSI